jgi:CheY-like chemotaxis protein
MVTYMYKASLNILLADDDTDDCELFESALKELPVATDLTIVNNGQQLMDLLNNIQRLPDLLLLDINMPLKNGIQCLIEIRQIPKLQDLCVVIFSTTIAKHTLNTLYDYGVQYYLRKPDLYSKLKESLEKIITLTSQSQHNKDVGENNQRSREDFILGFSK